MSAAWFIAASAAIIFTLGLVHLLYTFRGPKLHPRDAQLQARMEAVSLVLTRQTTMWKAWIGFNASHSQGAILFGLVYGGLALGQREVLFASPYLLVVGLVFLLAYVVLGALYWFKTPLRGILIATVLYAIGLGLASV